MLVDGGEIGAIGFVLRDPASVGRDDLLRVVYDRWEGHLRHGFDASLDGVVYAGLGDGATALYVAEERLSLIARVSAHGGRVNEEMRLPPAPGCVPVWLHLPGPRCIEAHEIPRELLDGPAPVVTVGRRSVAAAPNE
ncbi:MAG: hypothetical protein LC745_11250 [Planctomycetia bacterium]|nr:hypothetical protein [Planctomycetia bacterium]